MTAWESPITRSLVGSSGSTRTSSPAATRAGELGGSVVQRADRIDGPRPAALREAAGDQRDPPVLARAPPLVRAQPQQVAAAAQDQRLHQPEDVAAGRDLALERLAELELARAPVCSRRRRASRSRS